MARPREQAKLASATKRATSDTRETERSAQKLAGYTRERYVFHADIRAAPGCHPAQGSRIQVNSEKARTKGGCFENGCCVCAGEQQGLPCPPVHVCEAWGVSLGPSLIHRKRLFIFERRTTFLGARLNYTYALFKSQWLSQRSCRRTYAGSLHSLHFIAVPHPGIPSHRHNGRSTNL